MNDPLAVLAIDSAIAAATSAARADIDALLWRRDVRSAAAEVAAESVLRGGRASAAIDGADVAEADDSPMGRVLASALRLTAAVPGQVATFERAPLQALAALHALAASGFVDDSALGRPRTGNEADDPLNLGELPPATIAADRLVLLAQTLTRPSAAPALLVAAIAHAEIAILRPFAWGSGLMARAVTRLVLSQHGVDPDLFSIPEHGMVEAGRPAYVRALQAYSTGTADGVRQFVVWHSAACAIGAQAVVVP